MFQQNDCYYYYYFYPLCEDWTNFVVWNRSWKLNNYSLRFVRRSMHPAYSTMHPHHTHQNATAHTLQSTTVSHSSHHALLSHHYTSCCPHCTPNPTHSRPSSSQSSLQGIQQCTTLPSHVISHLYSQSLLHPLTQPSYIQVTVLLPLFSLLFSCSFILLLIVSESFPTASLPAYPLRNLAVYEPPSCHSK